MTVTVTESEYGVGTYTGDDDDDSVIVDYAAAVVKTYGGEDHISNSNNASEIFAGEGNDQVDIGGGQTHFVYTEAGNDVVRWYGSDGPGGDVDGMAGGYVYGGDGYDSLFLSGDMADWNIDSSTYTDARYVLTNDDVPDESLIVTSVEAISFADQDLYLTNSAGEWLTV